MFFDRLHDVDVAAYLLMITWKCRSTCLVVLPSAAAAGGMADIEAEPHERSTRIEPALLPILAVTAALAAT